MATRPDVQEKRDRASSQRRQAAARMHGEAADHEKRAAEISRMIAILQAEQISAMLAAALLRAKARNDGAL